MTVRQSFAYTCAYLAVAAKDHAFAFQTVPTVDPPLSLLVTLYHCHIGDIVETASGMGLGYGSFPKAAGYASARGLTQELRATGVAEQRH